MWGGEGGGVGEEVDMGVDNMFEDVVLVVVKLDRFDG